MTRFGNTSGMRIVIALMDARSTRLRGQMRRETSIVDDLQARIEEVEGAIGELRAQVHSSAYEGQYRRETLLRARGQRAVLLYAIAQRESERAELIEQCSNAQRNLNATRQSLLALDRRRDRRRDWLARACRQRQSMRELRAAEEFLEGGHRGWDQDR